MPSVEQARAEVGAERRAGHLLDDRGEHVAGGRVVEEEGAGLVRDRVRRGTSSSTARSALNAGSAWCPVDIVSRSRTRIALSSSLGVGRARRRGRIESTGSSRRQLAFGDGEADGGRGEALAQRVEQVPLLRVVGRPPALGDDLAVPQQHEAVHRVDVAIRRVDEGRAGGRRHALRFRRAARQRRCVGATGHRGETAANRPRAMASAVRRTAGHPDVECDMGADLLRLKWPRQHTSLRPDAARRRAGASGVEPHPTPESTDNDPRAPDRTAAGGFGVPPERRMAHNTGDGILFGRDARSSLRAHQEPPCPSQPTRKSPRRRRSAGPRPGRRRASCSGRGADGSSSAWR